MRRFIRHGLVLAAILVLAGAVQADARTVSSGSSGKGAKGHHVRRHGKSRKGFSYRKVRQVARSYYSRYRRTFAAGYFYPGRYYPYRSPAYRNRYYRYFYRAIPYGRWAVLWCPPLGGYLAVPFVPMILPGEDLEEKEIPVLPGLQ